MSETPKVQWMYLPVRELWLSSTGEDIEALDDPLDAEDALRKLRQVRDAFDGGDEEWSLVAVVDDAAMHKAPARDLATVTRERDEARSFQSIAKLQHETNQALRAEVVRECMRLAACGVVANANTPTAAAAARKMHPDYHSASCDDVARAVDREMELRAEVERLRGALSFYADRAAYKTHQVNHDPVEYECPISEDAGECARAALSPAEEPKT